MDVTEQFGEGLVFGARIALRRWVHPLFQENRGVVMAEVVEPYARQPQALPDALPCFRAYPTTLNNV